MAAEVIITFIVQKLADKLAADILGEVGRVWGIDIERDLEKLKDTLFPLQAVLQVAEEKQVTEENVNLWLSKLKDAAYDADDLIEELDLQALKRKPNSADMETGVVGMCWGKVQRFFSVSNNTLLVRRRMEPKIHRITERINTLAAQRLSLNLESDDRARARDRMLLSRDNQTDSEAPKSGAVGRVEEERNIVEQLLSAEHEKNIFVLPIVGMGGIGKTTLAQKVYNEPRLLEHFELRMWLSVTHDFSAAKIAKAMIETATGQGFSLSDMDSLQRNLRKLIGAKRYLLVLDDVWSEDPGIWQHVKDLLSFGAHGSVVLVTTRSGIVASLMATHDTFRLDRLSEDDAWLLFKQRAFVRGEEERLPNLVSIGRAIVSKCGGLPLAANALGALMRGTRDEWEWKSVLSSEIWDRPFHLSGILPALTLSYSLLPSDLKQCFAFCAVFPKGYAIEKETLIELWMGNGFVVSVSCGSTLFRELEQRCFFQDVKEATRWYDGHSITTCRMHDLMHDLARYKSRTECCTLEQWRDMDISANNTFRHALIINYTENKPPARQLARTATLLIRSSSHSSKTVRTLLFKSSSNQDDVQVISADRLQATLSSTKYLRVLSLDNLRMPEFPMAACDLRHLRYLDLSRNNFQTIPEAIVRLVYLQTLNLSACESIIGLPRCLSHMRCLMHFYLQGCKSLRSMPAGMGQLRHLKLLTKYVAGSEAGSGTLGELKELDLHGMLELCDLKNVKTTDDAQEADMVTKANLDKLDLDWGEPAPVAVAESPNRAANAEATAVMTDQASVFQALLPHKNLKQLKIRRYDGIRFPTWLMGESVLLSNLVELALADCSGCQHLPQLGQLPSLEVLEIGIMKSVTLMGSSEFYGSSSPVIDQNSLAFPKLRKIKLYKMDRLKEWSGSSKGQTIFPRIAEIEVIDCPQMTAMPALPSARILIIRNCPVLEPAHGFFGLMKSLQTLELDSSNQATSLLEQEDEDPLHSLTALTIKNCDKLMFSSLSLGMWKFFTSLEDLFIANCKGLVILPVAVFQYWSSLRTLTIHCCYNLVASSLTEKGLQFKGLPVLDLLNIQVCTKFPCFLPEGLRHLKALTRLLIYSNHGLTELPDFSEGIRDVTIYNCWKLESLPRGLGRLPALERLVLLNLRKVATLPEEIQGYKALKTLTIDDCPLNSLPVGIQQRLPSLNYLEIKNSPHLEKLCSAGGEYWPLVSRIPVKYIGNS